MTSHDMSYDTSERPDRTYGNTGPGAVLNTISFAGTTIGFFLIANRLYWRWRKGTPGIDDIIIVFAWIALFALGAVTYVAVDYGYGRSSSLLTRQEASDANRMFYLYQIFYKLTLNLSKLSILTLYLRVFDTKDWFGKITKFLVFLVLTFTFSIIVTNIFICNPISYYWNTQPPDDPSRKGGKCIKVLGYWYASSMYNIVSEVLMLFSVLIRIWTLPSHSQPPILQFRQKVNLTFVLGLGVFTVITAVLRVTTLNQSAMAEDKTGGTLVSTKWSSIEACVGLAVANLPMLRQLLRWRGWCGGHWFGSSADKSRSRGHSHSRVRNECTPTGQESLNRTHGSMPLSSEAAIPPITASTDIQMTRHFQREVVSCASDSGSVSNSTQTQDNDIESQACQYGESSTGHPSPSISSCRSVSSNGLKAHDGNVSSTNISSTCHFSRCCSSDAPSITSTLRSPTEPMPMIRISTEPCTTSLGLANRPNASFVSDLNGGAGMQLQSLSTCYAKGRSNAS